jgi:hypothetical protein
VNGKRARARREAQSAAALERIVSGKNSERARQAEAALAIAKRGGPGWRAAFREALP